MKCKTLLFFFFFFFFFFFLGGGGGGGAWGIRGGVGMKKKNHQFEVSLICPGNTKGHRVTDKKNFSIICLQNVAHQYRMF